MTTASTIYIGNTSIIEVDGLQDDDGDYLNDAEVTLETLVEKASGSAVDGIDLPLTLDYVLASNGKYQGEIAANVSVVAGRTYLATIQAVSGSLQGTWVETVVATNRSA